MIGLWIISLIVFAIALYAQNAYHGSRYAKLETRYAGMRDKAWYWYDAYGALDNNYQSIKRQYEAITYDRRIETQKANPLPKANEKDSRKYSVSMLPGMPELPKDKTLVLDESGIIIAADKPKSEEKPTDQSKNNGKDKNKSAAKNESDKVGSFSLEIADSVAKAMGIKSDDFSQTEKDKLAAWEKSGTKFDSDDAKVAEYVKRITNMRAKSGEKLTPDNVKGNGKSAENGSNGKSNGHTPTSLDALARIAESIAKLANN